MSHLGTAVEIGVITSSIVGVVVFVATSAIRHWISVIKKELHPNGGATMRDAVNRIEARQEATILVQNQQATAVAVLTSQLTDHLIWAKEKDRENREDRQTILTQAAQIALQAHDERGSLHRAVKAVLPPANGD